MRNSPRAAWLLARIVFAGAAGAVVIGGTLWVAHAPVDAFTVALLLPAMVFLLGVRSPKRVVIFGALLVGITGATWTLYALHRRESMAGVGIVMGGFYSLVSSIVGVSFELGRPSDLGIMEAELPVDQAAAPGEVRRRAW